MFKRVYFVTIASALLLMSTVTQADDITAIKQTLGLVLAKLQQIDDRLDSLETRMDQAEDDISILYSRADNVENVVIPDLDGRTVALQNLSDTYHADLYGSGSDPGLVTRVDTLEGLISEGSGGIVNKIVDIENSIVALEGVSDELTRYIKVGNKLVTFEGANVRVVNGTGRTNQINGLGNLVVGYNPMDSGSHNLVTGYSNEFKSYGGFVVGYDNRSLGAYSSVSGGGHNTAAGWGSSVSGGYNNTAADSTTPSIISPIMTLDSSLKQEKSSDTLAASKKVGGIDIRDEDQLELDIGRIDDLTILQGSYTAVSGGSNNRATGWSSSVSGGSYNVASKYTSAVSGGRNNSASGNYSSVQGGYYNTAAGQYSSISGGEHNTASSTYQSILD